MDAFSIAVVTVATSLFGALETIHIYSHTVLEVRSLKMDPISSSFIALGGDLHSLAYC